MSYKTEKLSKLQGGVGMPVHTTDFGKIIGWTIKDIGFSSICDEGGLVLELEKNGKTKRVVYGFNELGLWKEFEG